MTPTDPLTLIRRVSAGGLGYTHALRTYDAAQGVPFNAFAVRRIRGAMQDALREWNPGSRRRAQYRTAQPPPLAWVPLGPDADAVPDPAAPPDAPVHAAEQARWIAGGLARLPWLERTVVQWSFYDEVPLVEIGRRLGLSACYISQLRQRAIAQLRPILTPHVM
jgi:RNA polymerase sigma factor for flagellar operon FliA